MGGIVEGHAGALLSSLVAIPSVNPAFRQPGDDAGWFNEAALGLFVADWSRRAGLDVEIDEVKPGRPNVIARLRGTGGGPPCGGRVIWTPYS